MGEISSLINTSLETPPDLDSHFADPGGEDGGGGAGRVRTWPRRRVSRRPFADPDAQGSSRLERRACSAAGVPVILRPANERAEKNHQETFHSEVSLICAIM